MKCFCMIDAIKIDIRQRSVSIFSDPVLSGQLLKSRGWPLYTGSTVVFCESLLVAAVQPTRDSGVGGGRGGTYVFYNNNILI